MRSMTIELTDQDVAAIEAVVDRGEYASRSDVMRAALAAFLDEGALPPRSPSPNEVDAAIARYEAGTPLWSADEVRRRLAERLGW